MSSSSSSSSSLSLSSSPLAMLYYQSSLSPPLSLSYGDDAHSVKLKLGLNPPNLPLIDSSLDDTENYNCQIPTKVTVTPTHHDEKAHNYDNNVTESTNNLVSPGHSRSGSQSKFAVTPLSPNSLLSVPMVINDHSPTGFRVQIACEPCKKAKAKCDAGRPCTRCRRTRKEDQCQDAPQKKRGRKRSLSQNELPVSDNNPLEGELLTSGDYTDIDTPVSASTPTLAHSLHRNLSQTYSSPRHSPHLSYEPQLSQHAQTAPVVPMRVRSSSSSQYSNNDCSQSVDRSPSVQTSHLSHRCHPQVSVTVSDSPQWPSAPTVIMSDPVISHTGTATPLHGSLTAQQQYEQLSQQSLGLPPGSVRMRALSEGLGRAASDSGYELHQIQYQQLNGNQYHSYGEDNHESLLHKRQRLHTKHQHLSLNLGQRGSQPGIYINGDNSSNQNNNGSTMPVNQHLRMSLKNEHGSPHSAPFHATDDAPLFQPVPKSATSCMSSRAHPSRPSPILPPNRLGLSQSPEPFQTDSPGGSRALASGVSRMKVSSPLRSHSPLQRAITVQISNKHQYSMSSPQSPLHHSFAVNTSQPAQSQSQGQSQSVQVGSAEQLHRVRSIPCVPTPGSPLEPFAVNAALAHSTANTVSHSLATSGINSPAHSVYQSPSFRSSTQSSIASGLEALDAGSMPVTFSNETAAASIAYQQHSGTPPPQLRGTNWSSRVPADSIVRSESPHLSLSPSFVSALLPPSSVPPPALTPQHIATLMTMKEVIENKLRRWHTDISGHAGVDNIRSMIIALNHFNELLASINRALNNDCTGSNESNSNSNWLSVERCQQCILRPYPMITICLSNTNPISPTTPPIYNVPYLKLQSMALGTSVNDSPILRSLIDVLALYDRESLQGMLSQLMNSVSTGQRDFTVMARWSSTQGIKLTVREQWQVQYGPAGQLLDLTKVVNINDSHSVAAINNVSHLHGSATGANSPLRYPHYQHSFHQRSNSSPIMPFPMQAPHSQLQQLLDRAQHGMTTTNTEPTYDAPPTFARPEFVSNFLSNGNDNHTTHAGSHINDGESHNQPPPFFRDGSSSSFSRLPSMEPMESWDSMHSMLISPLTLPDTSGAVGHHPSSSLTGSSPHGASFASFFEQLHSQ